MKYVKVTLKNGEIKYINEEYPYRVDKKFLLVDSIKDAILYHNKYEFLVAWKKLNHYDIDKEIFLINLVDESTQNIITVNVDEKIKFDDRILYFSEFKFERLKHCFYDSSCFLYDNDDNCIAFPKTSEDYDKVSKIVYYKRGLTSAISDIFIYRNVSLPSCYSFYTNNKFMTFNENLLKIYLDKNIDECEIFTIYEKV